VNRSDLTMLRLLAAVNDPGSIDCLLVSRAQALLFDPACGTEDERRHVQACDKCQALLRRLSRQTHHPSSLVLVRSLLGHVSPEEGRLVSLHLGGGCRRCNARHDSLRDRIASTSGAFLLTPPETSPEGASPPLGPEGTAPDGGLKVWLAREKDEIVLLVSTRGPRPRLVGYVLRGADGEGCVEGFAVLRPEGDGGEPAVRFDAEALARRLKGKCDNLIAYPVEESALGDEERDALSAAGMLAREDAGPEPPAGQPGPVGTPPLRPGPEGSEPPPVVDTTGTVAHLLARLREGDSQARGALIEHSCERLRRLASRMLRRYPALLRWEQTGDVLNEALMRLWRALEQVRPESARHFYRLAALQTRRALIDLARHHLGPRGPAALHYDDPAGRAPDEPGGALDRAAPGESPETLEEWSRFHRQVEALPEDLREVVDMLWYQGLGQKEVAELLGVSERTLKRRWQEARVRLSRLLGGQ
jgi:RNA polymerase sigma factor (sigma-70 family)